jgi:nucleoside-diphosphate-sugar epimerase
MTGSVVVTGATGFLGRALASELTAIGHSVIALHRASSSQERVAELRAHGVITCDIDAKGSVSGALRGESIDTVFHLATHYVKQHLPQDVIPLMRANVEFGAELLDAVADRHPVVVTTMSYFQYRDGQPITNTLYSATKQAFSDICAFYREHRAIDIREVVMFDTYGPGDTRDKLVPHLIDAVRAHRAPRLGPRAQLIDLVHADDVARGLVAAASPSAPTMMTIRADKLIEIGELATLAAKSFPGAIAAEFADDRPTSDHVRVAGDWPRPPGWRPRILLENGIAELLR